MKRTSLLSSDLNLCPILMVLTLGAGIVLIPCLPTNHQAQAADPITSSGLNTQVSQPVTLPTAQTQYNITGGTRANGGTNLFHSFGDFNVPNNNIANFLNGVSFDLNGNQLPAGLQTSNILARVTGTNGNNPTLSSIYGTIQTTGFGNANLFLMNPTGFLFGPNATVNVGGMMTFTTANSMQLADVGRFNANPNAMPSDLLTAAPVAAFGFIGSNPGAIDFKGGQLTVAQGTGITLVGGDINLVPDSSGTPSSITAAGRPIQITSVAGMGAVAADTGIPAVGMALGTVMLGQGTTLDTSYNSGAALVGDGSGGVVSIRGGQFVATDAQILTSPAFGSTGQGGLVMIATTGGASLTNSTVDSSSFLARGNGGAVTMSASNLTLQDSAILTNILGDGTAAGGGGAVTLTGTTSVALTRSSISTDTFASNGSGGAVAITAPVVTLENSRILTGALGDGITPTTGGGGTVTLVGTTSLTLTESTIDTSVFDSQGNAGLVTLDAPTVEMQGGNVDTSLHNSTGDPNAGNAGDIEITGTNVTLTDLARLDSFADSNGTFSRGGTIRITGTENVVLNNGTTLLTTTVSQAPAGDIELLGQHVTITQSRLFSNTLASGASGTIKITGTGDIALNSGSVISTSAGLGSDGVAGPIEINTQHLTITGGSQIASETFGSGSGGTVIIQNTGGPAQAVLISDSGSGIFTDTLSTDLGGNILGTGAGGNIFVNANSFVLQNGGTISAETTGEGNAGDILVKADSVSITNGAQLTSSSSVRQTPFFPGEVIPSPTGNAGTVTIQGLDSPAQFVLIDGSGSGILTDTQGTGAGGNIFVNANSVTLTNGATVSASSTGQIENPGDAGSINITAINGLTMQNSAIKTQAGQGATGGNIKVTTAPSATVLLQDSLISASVADGPGGGGNISIDPQNVILLNSQILAQAAQGQGGAITIIANLFLPDANSIVNADSGKPGLNGTVTIQSPNAPGSGQVQPLGKSPLLPTSLLTQPCAAMVGGEFSSFTVAGRDSLPTEPGSWLASPLHAAGVGGGMQTEGVKAEGERLEDMTLSASSAEETPLLSLRQIAPAGFLTQAFAVDWAAGCQS